MWRAVELRDDGHPPWARGEHLGRKQSGSGAQGKPRISGAEAGAEEREGEDHMMRFRDGARFATEFFWGVLALCGLTVVPAMLIWAIWSVR